jgi:membrane protein YdbS with pleckstrin-like domain
MPDAAPACPLVPVKVREVWSIAVAMSAVVQLRVLWRARVAALMLWIVGAVLLVIALGEHRHPPAVAFRLVVLGLAALPFVLGLVFWWRAAGRLVVGDDELQVHHASLARPLRIPAADVLSVAVEAGGLGRSASVPRATVRRQANVALALAAPRRAVFFLGAPRPLAELALDVVDPVAARRALARFPGA